MDRIGAELCARTFQASRPHAPRVDEYPREFTRPGALHPDSPLLHCQPSENPAIVDASAWAMHAGVGYRGTTAIGQDLSRQDFGVAFQSLLRRADGGRARVS